jgi:hypothetical protein
MHESGTALEVVLKSVFAALGRFGAQRTIPQGLLLRAICGTAEQAAEKGPNPNEYPEWE